MKNIVKKAAAALLALAMCLSFAGCYSEEKTWAAKMGDDTMPIGGYLYYLSSAYTEASAKVSSEEDVLSSQIDGVDAEQWIRDRALQYIKSYYFMEEKCAELGLELSAEDLAGAEDNTDAMWAYYQAAFEPLGIAKESFHKTYSLYNMMSQKLLDALYGQGGEMALEPQELENFYKDNYYSYEYFYATLSNTEEDGSSVAMSEEEKAQVKESLEEYVEKIDKGETTVNDAATDYAYATVSDSTYNNPAPIKKDNASSALADTLAQLEEGDTDIAETTSGYYVVKKLPIADKAAEALADETTRLNLLSELKGEEFSDYIFQQADGMEGITLNQKGIDSANLSAIANASGKKGTSSASSEVSEAESSQAASSAAE